MTKTWIYANYGWFQVIAISGACIVGAIFGVFMTYLMRPELF